MFLSLFYCILLLSNCVIVVYLSVDMCVHKLLFDRGNDSLGWQIGSISLGDLEEFDSCDHVDNLGKNTHGDGNCGNCATQCMRYSVKAR